MISGAAILAWLSSFAGGVVVKLVVDGLSAWLAQRQADANAREIGRVTAQRDQADNTIAAQQAELQAQADAPRTADEAIKRLEEGSA